MVLSLLIRLLGVDGRLKITAPISLEIFFIQYSTILVALHSLLRHHFPNLHNTETLISLE